MDYLSLGPTPIEEPCEQLGPNYNAVKARKECERFVELLKKKFPPIPGTKFRIRLNPHDFGSYHDVEVGFDPDDPATVDYAFNIDANIPESWED